MFLGYAHTLDASTIAHELKPAALHDPLHNLVLRYNLECDDKSREGSLSSPKRTEHLALEMFYLGIFIPNNSQQK